MASLFCYFIYIHFLLYFVYLLCTYIVNFWSAATYRNDFSSITVVEPYGYVRTKMDGEKTGFFLTEADVKKVILYYMRVIVLYSKSVS